jgi:hypothetical protein
LKVVSKLLSELTPKEYKACLNLNMRSGGNMMYALSEHRKDADCHSIMLWDGDKLIGWALLVPTKLSSMWAWSTPYAKKHSKYQAQFYVRTSERKKGYGGLLMKEVLKKDPRPHVLPWDERSASLFANYPVTADGYRRRIITKVKTKKRKAAVMNGAQDRR